MAVFISSQLDFIFFFYGLAFLLLGVTCFALARSGRLIEPWTILGLFGLIHGLSEWLALGALVLGDSAEFALIRLIVMAASFVFLCEFARREAARLGWVSLSRWIYLPIVAGIAVAFVGSGLAASDAVTRYSLGFIGAMATSLVFARYARDFTGIERHWATLAAVTFGLYGVATGLVVAPVSFWPASVINTASFIQIFGVPIQLIRGLLACSAAFAIWASWRHRLVMEVASIRYAAYLRRQFLWTLLAMAIILVAGWTLTDFLGNIYKQNVELESESDIDLLMSHIASETGIADGMAKVVAAMPMIAASIQAAEPPDASQAPLILPLIVEASGAERAYVFDNAAAVVWASPAIKTNAAFPAAAAPALEDALAGRQGTAFFFDPAKSVQFYYVASPVRASDAHVIGAVLLTKPLKSFATLKHLNRPYFLVDPNGLITETNQQNLQFHGLWPSQADTLSALRVRDTHAVLPHEIHEGEWLSVNGEENYVRRRFIGHSYWSIVVWKPTQAIFASRVLGIIVTLLVTVMTLIYLFGRERWVHEKVQADKRMQLQALAHELGLQATTDALTGLSNRLKFNQALAQELLRCERYGMSLSLVLLDVDKFKIINDSRGHLTGDKVLVELSRTLAACVRAGEIFARWGGEEFVLLLPQTDIAAALRAAERLRDAVSQGVYAHGGKVTCSFGIAQYEADDTAETFVARADAALYRAKINGRNRIEQEPPLKLDEAANGSFTI